MRLNIHTHVFSVEKKHNAQRRQQQNGVEPQIQWVAGDEVDWRSGDPAIPDFLTSPASLVPPEQEHDLEEDMFEPASGLGGLDNGQMLAVEERGGSGIVTQSAPPNDSVRELTRRLVAATTQFEIQQIIAEAFRNLGNLRMAAIGGDGSDSDAAKAIIRRYEQLVRRGNRKISDLNKEDDLKREQIKAERDEKIQRAKAIAAELRRRMIERRNREEGYLREHMKEDVLGVGGNQAGKKNPNAKLDAATEAKIAAQAKAMAATEATVGTGGGAGVSGGGSSAAGVSVGSPEDSSYGGFADNTFTVESAGSGSIDVAV